MSTAAELRTAIQQLTVELEAKEREIERFRSEGQALSNEKLNQGEEAHQLRQEIENITRSLDKMKDDEGYLKKKVDRKPHYESLTNFTILEHFLS